MDTSTHAFADPREATTYTLLQRVLQNHCTTHGMSLLAALTAAVVLLAGTCVQCCAAGGVEEGTLMQQLLAGLKQQVRTWQARGPCLPLAAEAEDGDPHGCVPPFTRGVLGHEIGRVLGRALRPLVQAYL